MNRFLEFKDEVSELVLSQLPTAIPEAIDKDIQEVVRQFYTRTTTWRVSLGPFGRPGNTPYVILSGPVGTGIAYVHQVFYRGCKLNPTDAGDGFYWDWNADRPELLTIYPVVPEDEFKVVSCEASLLPKDLDAELPDTAVSHHLGTITAGCLARLYGQSSKPWYNLVEARSQRNEWARGLAEAKAIAARGYAPRPVMAYNPFGRFA